MVAPAESHKISKFIELFTEQRKSSKTAVPKLGAAKTCESCCIYRFPHKNYNVKLLAAFYNFTVCGQQQLCGAAC